MKLAYFTICARNYLAYALTLRASIEAIDADARFFIFLSDDPIDDNDIPRGEILSILDLEIENIEELKFKYNILELSTAIKPSCFLYLLETKAFDSAIYLDPDIQVFAPLKEVEKALGTGTSCVLTPHLLEPLDDELSPTDLDVLITGTFNLGFAAFSRSAEAIDFIRWWERRVNTHCFVDLQNGLFVDQKFVEFAPSFIQNLEIIRHPGYNVAYWNLANRTMRLNDEQVEVNGKPLIFFHFSGVVPENSDVLSKHQNRFKATDDPLLAKIVRAYLGELTRFNHSKWGAVSYAFDKFRTGERILDVFRRGPPSISTDPFDAPNLEYWSELVDRNLSSAGGQITRYMLAVYYSRRDLMETFSLQTVEGRLAYKAWLSNELSKEDGNFQSLVCFNGSAPRPGWRARAWLYLGRVLRII